MTCAAPGCEKLSQNGGDCWKHYNRRRRYGSYEDRRVVYGEPIVRFSAKVIPDGDCWRWAASLNAFGYGRFGVDGKNVLAHRWAYEYYVAEIPPGLTLDHLCRNRWCVNPYHLEPVPQSVNARRAGTLLGGTP